MGKYEDARENLNWLREELLAAEEEFGEYEEEYEEDCEEEFEEEEERCEKKRRRPRSSRNRAVDFGRMVYDDEGSEAAGVYIDPPRKKGILGYLILAILEILAILAIVRWWIQWL